MPKFIPPPAPPPSEENEYNFCAASARDGIVFGAERPGYVHPLRNQERTPRGAETKAEAVVKWINYMWKRGIRRVLCLLSPEELKFYQHSLLDSFKQRFEHVSSVSTTDASLQQLLTPLTDAMEHNEPIIVHCSTGQGRTAHVLALWLHRRYNVGIDQAVREVSSMAKTHSAFRKPTVEAVVRLLIGRSEVLSANTMELVQQQQEERCHVSFIQMGGTIDKEYPRATSGYAFEIGEPAVKRILKNLLTGFTYDCTSVCRKDSQDISSADRTALVECLSRVSSNNIIVTHGTDTLIDTAQFLTASADSFAEKTVVCTGAMRPERMQESDAAFNIGCAVSAATTISPGVYVAMNGRIFPANKCQRDMQTGLFQLII